MHETCTGLLVAAKAGDGRGRSLQVKGHSCGPHTQGRVPSVGHPAPGCPLGGLDHTPAKPEGCWPWMAPRTLSCLHRQRGEGRCCCGESWEGPGGQRSSPAVGGWPSCCSEPRAWGRILAMGSGEQPTCVASGLCGAGRPRVLPQPNPCPAGDGLQGSGRGHSEISRSCSLSRAPPPGPQRPCPQPRPSEGPSEPGSRLRGWGVGSNEGEERATDGETETGERHTERQDPSNPRHTPLLGCAPARTLLSSLSPSSAGSEPPTARHPKHPRQRLLCGFPCPWGVSALSPPACPMSRHPAAHRQGQRTGLAFGVMG